MRSSGRGYVWAARAAGAGAASRRASAPPSPAAGAAWGAPACSPARSAIRRLPPAPQPSGSCGLRAALLARDARELRGARVELLRAERLREELARAQLHRLPVLLLLAGGGEDDAGQVAPARIGPDPGQHVEATELRHHQVEQHEADVGLPGQHVERFATVVRQGDPERTLLELHLDDATDVRLIIGDEH